MFPPAWEVAQFPQFPEERIMRQSFEEWFASQSDNSTEPDRHITLQVFLIYLS